MHAAKATGKTGSLTLHYFTLVELLVVIAIISVLAGLLLPALSRAQQSARKTFCANTENQIGLAVFNFVGDYHGYLPCSIFSHKEPGYQDELFPPDAGITVPYNDQDWCERDLPSNLIWPYWSPLQKAVCPSHPNRAGILAIIAKSLDSWQIATSYLLSKSHFSNWCQSSWSKKRLASTPHPSRLFMVLEREDYPNQNTNNYSDSWFERAWGTYGVQTMGYHHMNYGGFNALFFDGHVRFYAFDHQPLDRTEGPLEVNNWQ